MKVLIIDRDNLSSQLIKSKLEDLGHEVSEETSKNDAVDRIAATPADVVFMDPSPLTSARPITLNIRRSVSNYPYIILTSDHLSHEEAVSDGANDLLKKPLDANVLESKMTNADRIIHLVERIGDTTEDFPSAGGVIAKSAFNQLFLSAVDRADRYGEQTYILFISIENYQEILEMDGPYAADFAAAQLSQCLVRLRRQSDIIAQTAKYEYALLLQRPMYEAEPMEAANRFAEQIAKQTDLTAAGNTNIQIGVMLIDLPMGADIVHHVVTPGS